MKLLLSIFLCFSTVVFAKDKKITAPRPIVSAELEWEPVEGAKGYEIQIETENFNKKFSSKTPLFQLQIPIGTNKARGRSYDARGVYGEWSEYVEFEAVPQRVDLKKSYEQTPPVVKIEGYKGFVKLQWSPITAAKSYKLYLKDSEGKILATKEMKTAFSNFTVRPGKYIYNITAIYSGGIESEQSEFQAPLEVTGSKLEPPLLVSTEKDLLGKVYKFKVSDPALRIIATIEYSAYLSETWESFKVDTFKDIYTGNQIVQPGRYRLNFRSHMQGFTDSAPIIQEFAVKPTALAVGE